MRGGTLFSGIGAPELAMPWIDWRWAAEIDPFASAVHAARFPGIPNLGDVNGIDTDAIEPVDLVVFGSPCQSFSVAGKRLGLDDPRGNMALVGLRVVGRLRPRWVAWENVPGVLSSDGGRDFGSFLGLLGELGYGFAYRVLDAQHFGVPQRRRRVFVVGHLGDWRSAAAVLFEPESLRGDSPPRRETGQRTAPPVASCPEGGSGYRCDADTADGLIAGFNNTGQGWWNSADIAAGLRDMSAGSGSKEATLIAFSAKDHGADHGDLAPTLRAGTHDKSHANAGVMPAILFDPTARQPEWSINRPLKSDGPLAIAFAQNSRDEVRLFGGGGDLVGALAAEPGTKQQSYIAHTLRADGFDASEDGTGRGTPLIPILEVGKGSSSRGAGPNGAGFGKDGDPMFTLQSGAQHAIGGGMSVRRLTPVECERLQGLPDNWTAIAYRGKPAADGPRYRAIGNSMAVPVVRWLGERIRRSEETAAAREAAD